MYSHVTRGAYRYILHTNRKHLSYHEKSFHEFYRHSKAFILSNFLFFYLMGILSKHYHSMKKTVSLSIKKKIIQFLEKNKPNIANSIED